MEILNVKNLRKSFGQNEVLKGIDLSLERGEVLSIIGSSGGGKTTFLRCLNFLELADEGEISVNGEVVYSAKAGEKPEMSPEAQLSLGLVFQQFNLFPQYTVKGNLTLAPILRAKRAKSPTLKEDIEKFLPLYLKNTNHYIYLSTYRVYATMNAPTAAPTQSPMRPYSAICVPRISIILTDSLVLPCCISFHR